MQISVLLLFLALGSCIGSFSNALAYRLRHKLDWVKGRSRCDHCHTTLTWLDLIPVVSWLATRGMCRYCHVKTGTIYVVSELIGAVAFGASYWYWPHELTGSTAWLQFGLWLCALVLLMCLFMYDLQWFILPDKLMVPLIGIGALYAATVVLPNFSLSKLFGLVASVAVSSGIFFALYQISNGAYIGGGDVKYGLFYGLVLASPLKSFLVICLASFLGTLLAVPLLIRRRISGSTVIPFGPLLIGATIMIFLFGDHFIGLMSTIYLFP